MGVGEHDEPGVESGILRRAGQTDHGAMGPAIGAPDLEPRGRAGP